MKDKDKKNKKKVSSFRLPIDVKDYLTKQAKSQGTTISNIIIRSLEAQINSSTPVSDLPKYISSGKIKKLDAKKHKEQLDINDKNFIVSNVVKKAPKKMDIEEVKKIFGELPQKIKEDEKMTIDEVVKKDIKEIKNDKKKLDIEAVGQMFGKFDLNKIPQVANHTPMTSEEYTTIFQEITISVLQKCIENDEEVDMNKIMSLAVIEFNKNYGEQTGYNFLGKENIC